MGPSAVERPPQSPVKGEYVAPTTSDVRGPCPVINTLANHGYISRDGRSVHPSEIIDGLQHIGLSLVFSNLLTHPIFLEHPDPAPASKPSPDPSPSPPRSTLGKIWHVVRNPRTALADTFGMRRRGQVDAAGRKCLDLDQLALHGAVEHDVSLTRRDFAQGDNRTPQPDLVRELLAASSDGGTTFLLEDLCALRRRRIEEQRTANPGLTYGAQQHQLACGEIAFAARVFGDGKKIPFGYVRALFEEERLPIREGWKSRHWWKFGLLESIVATSKAKKIIGLKF